MTVVTARAYGHHGAYLSLVPGNNLGVLYMYLLYCDMLTHEITVMMSSCAVVCVHMAIPITREFIDHNLRYRPLIAVVSYGPKGIPKP